MDNNRPFYAGAKVIFVEQKPEGGFVKLVVERTAPGGKNSKRRDTITLMPAMARELGQRLLNVLTDEEAGRRVKEAEEAAVAWG